MLNKYLDVSKSTDKDSNYIEHEFHVLHFAFGCSIN